MNRVADISKLSTLGTRCFGCVRSRTWSFLFVTVVPWAFVVLSGLALSGAHALLAVRAAGPRWRSGPRVSFAELSTRSKGGTTCPTGRRSCLPKHQSTWETFWLPTAMPRDLTFVYKRELNWVPFFGWGIASAQMISIDRSKGQDAFEQVVEQGKDRLARGWWIVIFPEGTRTKPGASRRYKTGGARLAVRTGHGRCRLPSTRASSGQRAVHQNARNGQRIDRSGDRPEWQDRGRSRDARGDVDRVRNAQACAASIQRTVCAVQRARYRKCCGGGCLSQQLLLAFDSLQSIPTPQVSSASERRLAIANQILVYRLHRVRRRTIGFQVNESGLTIRAPRSVALKEIESAIVENQRWIFTKQIEWRAWSEQLRQSAIRLAEGGVVRYLGKPMTLRLASQVNYADNNAREIRLALPVTAAEADVRQALQAWLYAQASIVIGERFARFADRIPDALCRLAIVVRTDTMGVVLAQRARSSQLAPGAFRAAGH